jgi:hypothetical protein
MVGLEDDAAVAGRNALWTVPEPEVMDGSRKNTARPVFPISLDTRDRGTGLLTANAMPLFIHSIAYAYPVQSAVDQTEASWSRLPRASCLDGSLKACRP